jgi:hypothetical protein
MFLGFIIKIDLDQRSKTYAYPGLQHILCGLRLPGGDQTLFHGPFMGVIVILNRYSYDILYLCPMCLSNLHDCVSLLVVCLCCLIIMIQTSHQIFIYFGYIFDEIFSK